MVGVLSIASGYSPEYLHRLGSDRAAGADEGGHGAGPGEQPAESVGRRAEAQMAR